MTPTTMMNTNFTQPAECYNSRDAVPATMSSNLQYYNQVPLYQTKSPDRDMKAVLQSSCSNGVWIYEDPDPCTAVCDSGSAAEAKKTMYCLNAQMVIYGTKTEKASAVARRPMGWLSLAVGGLRLSRMFI
ncbi:unnamed protein product [Penicillium nalgiovense]|uniref:Uncharacterized protein n=1 Tax=Penicillium nalgiovense TaxID=60175 RepID=A0A1V6X655_PENNA|nr:hypothetical protein PENNAL_c0114G02751 [Penicillium nalgiovense]CAG8030311.1 unnamed protein product [Penicillium nalgiovense]